jgi:hypothetical protein
LYSRRPPASLTDKETVVLADFANTTGDPVFDGALRQGLAIQFQQSTFLSLTSDTRIQQLLRLMGQPVGAKLTPAIARDICEREGGGAILEGSIASLGAQYVLGVRATGCRSGGVLGEEQEQVAKKEDVLNALSDIASRLRVRLGESLATLDEHNRPLPNVSTTSLDALKAYSAGLLAQGTQGSAVVIEQYKRASEIDRRGVRARDSTHDAGVRASRAGHRRREVLHHGDLSSPGHRQSRSGAPGVRLVGADLSAHVRFVRSGLRLRDEGIGPV